MSKNLTRKGLALGAVVALGTTLFAGAPAFAAGTASTDFTLAPAAGTTYNSIAGSTFDLASTITTGAVQLKYGATTGPLANLSFLVTNAGGASLDVAFDGAAAAATNDHKVRTGATATTTDLTGASSSTDAAVLTAKNIVVSGQTGNGGVSTASTLKNHLKIHTSSAATANVVVGVTAFIDENGNGVIDDTDLVSPTQTVTFIPAANVTATTTVTAAVIGSSVIAGKVVLGGDINMANLGTDVKISFANAASGSTADITPGTGSTNTSWDVNSGGLVNVNQATASPITAGTVTAQAYYLTTATKLGSVSGAVAPAFGTNASVDAIDVLKTTGTATVIGSSTATTVKTGYNGAITFKTQILSSSVALASAGVPVSVTLTKTALAAASTFTVGTAVLTATSGPVVFKTVTAADGSVTFTGVGTGAKDDVVAVSVAALKSTTGYTTATTNTLTWADETVAKVVNTDVKGTNGQLKSTVGGSYTLNYSVVNQFGAPFTAARRLALTKTSGTAVFAYYPVFANGVASQTIVDNSTAAGTVVVNAVLQKLDTTGTWVADTTAGLTQAADVTVNLNSKVTSAVTAVSSAGTTKVSTITNTLVAADLNVDSNSQTAAGIGYGTATAAGSKDTIDGYATDATGVGVAGQTVTITGAGLGFLVGNVYTIGSATVTSDNVGHYSVLVFSTTAGAQTVTVTAGAATATATITYTGITSLAKTNVLTIDASSLSQVGRSVTVSVKVVDKFGNVVSGVPVAVSVTGVGSLSAATATTDSKGVGTVQFVAGANDFGDAVVTAKFTATDADATVISATKTLTVGVTDAQVDIVNNRVTAVSSFTKGKTVSFYVDGVKKWSKTSASDADVVLNYNLKKGTHTVTVKISGGFVTTEKFIVK